jgi:hypothetical protein
VEEQAVPGKRHPDAPPVEGLHPDPPVAVMVRRALGGELAMVGGVCVDSGHPGGHPLTGTVTELIEGGMLALAGQNGGLRRARANGAGPLRSAQVRGILGGNHR